VSELDRRGLLKAACAGCAALGLAACGGSSTPPADTADPTSAAPSPTAGAASPTAAAASAAIIKLDDIPVGGSVSARAPSGKKLVLARPTETTVVAFSSTCTHQGCTVDAAGKRYECPCHGSVYDAFTGKNLSGPAPSPLPRVAVKIAGTEVVEA
jgi:Rieske Fe-S protein